jgi:hypothetical protein
MTKSPRRLAREALALAREALPAYSCPTSRKDFTQPQLFALLALKAFLKADYRGVVAFVADFPELQKDLGLAKVPHFSTLCYAERRLLQKGASASCSAVPSAAPGCAAWSAPGRPRPSMPPTWTAATPPATTPAAARPGARRGGRSSS